VSSANRSGQPTPNEVPAVVEQLGAHVGVFFDAGPAPEGPPSSIVDLTGERPRLLREGAIPAAELELVLEEPFDDGG
jgi:tRNA A37 threonylcarbamoyladenosine synthetase subunit TsaC/SUA5/YrdC